MTPAPDPVLVRRARIARLVRAGQRVGYGLFGLAMIGFVVGFATDFPEGLVTAVLVCLVLGSLVLAPSIVLGYAVKAADRADRENTWG